MPSRQRQSRENNGMLDSYGMDAPTLNGINVPKWRC
jgi:hypothetical protein